MSADAVVIHGHVYQPPRADPRVGEVPVEPSAAPFHDWNSRITAECYRPNAYARVYDGSGRILSIVNNYERMSFDLGPTLARWLADHAPDVLGRMIAGDRVGGTAIAHPFHHVILPLANRRDALTELRWGLADFRVRFGREARGTWLAETAADEATLEVVADAGLAYTILAPHQVVPPVPAGRVGEWVSGGRRLRLCVYDGPVSHDMAFGMAIRDTDSLVARMSDSAPSGLVVAATDAETFGHHHRFTERGVAHALFVSAPGKGLRTGPLDELVLGAADPFSTGVITSAWSCAHGVGRWQADCGCSSDGQVGSHQRWRAPLRRALDLLHAHALDVYARLGAEVFHDPWAARDDYGDVLADPARWDDFVERHVRALASAARAEVLLRAQEASLASFTSCAWFFADLARREAAIVLQEAALTADLLESLGEPAPVAAALDILDTAESIDPDLATGRDVWQWALAGGDVGTWEPAPTDPLQQLVDRLASAAAAGDAGAAAECAAVVETARLAHRSVSLDHAQELVFEAFPAAHLRGLATTLGFADELVSLR